MDDLSMVSGGRVRVRSAGLRGRQRPALRALGLALGAFLVLAAFAGQARALELIGDGNFFSVPNDGVALHQQRIAVDQASGDVLVTNVVDDTIDVYAADGTSLTSFGSGDLTDPFGIAIDQSNGDVYVSDSGRDRIVRFNGDGQPTPTYTVDGAFTSPTLGSGAGEIGDFAAALSIDGAAGKLLVADPGNNRVERFRLDGGYDGFSFDGTGSDEGAFTGLLDLAVDDDGDVIVVDSTGDVARGDPATSRVLRFSSGGGYEARIGASLPRPATVGVRPTGNQVIVSARQDAVNLLPEGPPTVDVYAASGAHLASAAFPQYENDFSVITGVASATGADGRLYVASDVDRTYAYLPDRWGVAAIWAYDVIPTTPPAISAQTIETSATSARVVAEIETNGSAVDYHVEYGVAGAGLTERTADVPLAGSGGTDRVVVDLTGLAPQTDYVLRIVADNGEGVFDGGDQPFATRPLAATSKLDPVTDVTRTGATLHAALDMQNAAGSYGFVVDQVGGPLHIDVPRVELGAGAATAVSTRVEGLAAGQTYRVGITVLTAGGYVTATPITFTTAGNPLSPDPARSADAGSPYGCAAPRLDPVAGAVRGGQELTLTGADLGVYGIVHVGGEQAQIRSYASNRVSIVVPSELSGSVALTLDCGKLAGSVSLTIAGMSPSAPSPKIAGAAVSGKVATLRVQAPAKGTLAASGRYLRGASARLGKAGTATLRLRLTRAGSRALARARGRRLKVTVSVRYTPAGGSAKTMRKAVVFKR